MTEAHEREAVYVDDDGAVVYRASSLGRCVGALVRARLGVTGSPPPEMMQEKFDEGHEFEERVILKGLGEDWTRLDGRKLKEYGVVVEDPATGLLQVTTEIRWGNAEKGSVKVIRCHPDAIAMHGSRYPRSTAGNLERRVVEAKFFGKDLFYETIKNVNKAEKAGANPLIGLGDGYAMQAAIEMHSTGLGILYVIGLKERDEDGELSLGEVWTLEADDPPFTLAEIKARVLEVEGYVARGEMPACPLPLDYPCPYWAEHEDVEREEIDDEAMVELVRQWAQLDIQAHMVADQAAQVKEKIQARMGDLRMTSGPCGGWEVNVITPEQGNVRWAEAYKALSKQTGARVDEDEYRGKVGETYVRLSKVKEKK